MEQILTSHLPQFSRIFLLYREISMKHTVDSGQNFPEIRHVLQSCKLTVYLHQRKCQVHPTPS